MSIDVEAAHKRSIRHRPEIEASKICGCFYCLSMFPASAVTEWVPDTPIETALCPHCGIDSVIGDASGFEISDGAMRAMHRRWFET